MSRIKKKSLFKLSKAARKLGKRTSAVQAKLGPQDASMLEAVIADVVAAAGGRKVEYAAVHVSPLDVGHDDPGHDDPGHNDFRDNDPGHNDLGDHCVVDYGEPAVDVGIDRARAFVRRHPLGAVVVVALGAACIELQVAVGVLAGLGTAVLLVSRDGASTRQRVATHGRRALASLRDAYGKRGGLRRSSVTPGSSV